MLRLTESVAQESAGRLVLLQVPLAWVKGSSPRAGILSIDSGIRLAYVPAKNSKMDFPEYI